MFSIILVSTTFLFCFGLFVIFRLFQNSKRVNYKIGKMEFLEYKEYLSNTIKTDEQDMLQVEQEVVQLVQEKERLFHQHAVAESIKEHQRIIARILEQWRKTYDHVTKNTAEMSKGKSKAARLKLETAMLSINQETVTAIAELETINSGLASLQEKYKEINIPSDEEKGQKGRAEERIQKLRNLSFNVNSANTNNEFDTVPAYIRRNLELYNTISYIESFYSNVEVKKEDPDDASSTKSTISTINTFLDGQKPD
ncbi:MAG: hypothetical protein P0Y53_12355 [Candidatus Pseudobacter hemicellulosilyticus]|uniref:Uncharacterized protein n=1 Tax=Candidatus Pseudobacter hemicellulosilyticus TaxID=3121375 RepID=A0AAJ5WWZ2_9BACT|nr:MAG: hypothetical protein P0Y53_12355 [Pseudobacter sp.]